MARGFFLKYDNQNPLCLAASLSVHICKSEGTYQSFIYLPTYLTAYLRTDLLCLSSSYPNVYSVVTSMMAKM